MDSTTRQVIEPKLDAIIRLLAAPLTDGKPIAESAPRLASLGLDNNTVASICNTSPDVVRTAIRRSKSGKSLNANNQKKG